ncbi:MAG: helix-turn-helix transcriptional regulator [Prevotella sp.]|nr:helix-turn-helix transcriptional regulator [Prevotella sp.]
MKNHKVYEADDKMISLIRDNYNVLQSLGCFGINLGFGDKSVNETCQDNGVDTYTFLAVVNYTINGYYNADDAERLSIPTLLHYLQACHVYYLDYQLPSIRRELQESISEEDGVGHLIMNFYDEYAREIRKHMKYEEKMLFPYVNALLNDEVRGDYDIETFSKKHGQTDQKLKELKNIILKYLPADSQRNNKLTATLYGIYNNEEWLNLHASVEDNIFVPAIRKLEQRLRKDSVAKNITSMVFPKTGDMNEQLSDREKDVVVALVQGMSNKQIADHLYISVNTVITHRRNIARKLQIHSSVGLTIYAIVNGLVDISSVKL